MVLEMTCLHIELREFDFDMNSAIYEYIIYIYICKLCVIMCSYLFSSPFFPSHLFLSLLISSHCNLILILCRRFSLLVVSSHSNLDLMSSHLFLLKSSSYVFSSFLISVWFFCLFSCLLLSSHLFPLLLISFSCLFISSECLLTGLEQRRGERWGDERGPEDEKRELKHEMRWDERKG